MIKAEFLDLGPHNGMKEPDPEGSYRAFTVYDEGQPGDIPQSLTFLVPAHSLPTDHAQAELQAAVAAEREAIAKLIYNCASKPEPPFDDYFNMVADTPERHARMSIAYDRWTLTENIRARTPADAPAALEAVKREARNEALREALAKIESHIEMVSSDSPTRFALDWVRDDILALMEDQSDE